MPDRKFIDDIGAFSTTPVKRKFEDDLGLFPAPKEKPTLIGEPPTEPYGGVGAVLKKEFAPATAIKETIGMAENAFTMATGFLAFIPQNLIAGIGAIPGLFEMMEPSEQERFERAAGGMLPAVPKARMTVSGYAKRIEELQQWLDPWLSYKPKTEAGKRRQADIDALMHTALEIPKNFIIEEISYGGQRESVNLSDEDAKEMMMASPYADTELDVTGRGSDVNTMAAVLAGTAFELYMYKKGIEGTVKGAGRLRHGERVPAYVTEEGIIKLGEIVENQARNRGLKLEAGPERKGLPRGPLVMGEKKIVPPAEKPLVTPPPTELIKGEVDANELHRTSPEQMREIDVAETTLTPTERDARSYRRKFEPVEEIKPDVVLDDSKKPIELTEVEPDITKGDIIPPDPISTETIKTPTKDIIIERTELDREVSEDLGRREVAMLEDILLEKPTKTELRKQHPTLYKDRKTKAEIEGETKVAIDEIPADLRAKYKRVMDDIAQNPSHELTVEEVTTLNQMGKYKKGVELSKEDVYDAVRDEHMAEHIEHDKLDISLEDLDTQGIRKTRNDGPEFFVGIPLNAFYSTMADFVKGRLPDIFKSERAKGDLRAWAKLNKRNELEYKWSGVEPFIEANKGSITKGELQDYVNASMVRLEEHVRRTDAERSVKKHDLEDQLEGLETMATEAGRPDSQLTYINREADTLRRELSEIDSIIAQYEPHVTAGGSNYREFVVAAPELTPKFTTGHFEYTGNVIYNILAKDRTTADGKKFLHIEQMQSDIAKNMRRERKHVGLLERSIKEEEKRIVRSKKGEVILEDVTPQEFVTHSEARIKEMNESLSRTKAKDGKPFIFEKTWHELAIRRLTQRAAEEGYDGISWHKANEVVRQQPLEAQGRVEKYFEGLYDKDMPTYANKWGEQWGTKVEIKTTRPTDAEFAERNRLRDRREELKRTIDEINKVMSGRDASIEIANTRTDFHMELESINKKLGGDLRDVDIYTLPITPEMMQSVTTKGVELYSGLPIDKITETFKPIIDQIAPAFKLGAADVANYTRGLFRVPFWSPKIHDVANYLHKMERAGNKWTNMSQRKMKPYLDLPKELKAKANEFILESDKTGKLIKPEKFAELKVPKEVQDAYYSVRDGLDMLHKRMLRRFLKSHFDNAITDKAVSQHHGLNEKAYTSLNSEAKASLRGKMITDSVDSFINEHYLPGYFPRYRFGRYVSVITRASDGKVVDVSGFDYKHQAQGHMDRYVNTGEKTRVIDTKHQQSDFTEMMTIGNYIPLIEKILKDAGIEDASIKDITGTMSSEWFKRFAGGKLSKRNNVPGYSFDVERSLVEYTNKFPKAIIKRFGKANVQNLIKAVPETNGLRNYASDLGDYFYGITQREGKINRASRTALYISYLALKPAFAVLNATQRVTMTAPWTLRELETRGGHNALTAAVKAEKYILSAQGKEFRIVADRVKSVGKEGRQLGRSTADVIRNADYLSREEKYVLLEMYRQGEFRELRVMEIGGGGGFSQALKYLDAFGVVSERSNRVHAALTGVNLYKDMGMKGPKLVEAVDKFMNATQIMYSKANRPKIGRGLMAPAFVFKTYMFNFLSMYGNLLKTSPAAFAMGVGTIVALGGYKALPFYTGEVDTAIDYYMTNVRKDPTWPITKRQMANYWNDERFKMFANGIPSVLGIETSSMIGFPDVASAAIMPMIRAGLEFPKNLFREDMTTQEKFNRFFPSQIRKWISVYKMGKYGLPTDRTGKPIITDKEIMELPKEIREAALEIYEKMPKDLPPSQKFIIAMGFPTRAMNRYYADAYAIKSSVNNRRSFVAEMNRALAQAVSDDDDDVKVERLLDKMADNDVVPDTEALFGHIYEYEEVKHGRSRR
jgi:hypothetical protein